MITFCPPRDWRKPDLSVEVVAFAAPDVIELNLYWSGNQAILRAWSCPEGIPRLKKLKRVILHAAPVRLSLPSFRPGKPPARIPNPIAK